MKIIFENWREFLEATKKCPEQASDPALNNEKRSVATKQAMYGPANPSLENDEYWQAYAKDAPGEPTPEEAKTMRCASCAFFNTTERILECLEDSVAEDPLEKFTAGGFGYCEKWNFYCREERTCLSWASGGPQEDVVSDEEDM